MPLEDTNMLNIIALVWVLATTISISILRAR